MTSIQVDAMSWGMIIGFLSPFIVALFFGTLAFIVDRLSARS